RSTPLLSLITRPPPRATPFPTRRSSDLQRGCAGRPGTRGRAGPEPGLGAPSARLRLRRPGRDGACGRGGGACGRAESELHEGRRSEEHTSELQSRENLVCRLLLEKKKM